VLASQLATIHALKTVLNAEHAGNGLIA